jgi:hypothetical protein
MRFKIITISLIVASMIFAAASNTLAAVVSLCAVVALIAVQEPEVITVHEQRARKRKANGQFDSEEPDMTFGTGMITAIEMNVDMYKKFGSFLTYRYDEDQNTTYLGYVVVYRNTRRFIATHTLTHDTMIDIEDKFVEYAPMLPDQVEEPPPYIQ